MEWEGSKSDRYALVTICFRDGDMEHYDEVIYSKDTFVNNNHIQLLQMYYPGVTDEPLDAGSTSPYSEYWHDGMQAVSIDRIRYITTQDFDTIQKFNMASYLGAEDMDNFNATPYSNWFGACLTADGRCFEATMSDCRALGGRFQGPGTSCGGYQQPLMMAETFESQGTNTQGKGLLIAITVGVMTGVLTTIFGNVASEMWLDRLREDPELHTTPDDLNGPE